jgi:DNA-3-methyladenine glycosylase I
MHELRRCDWATIGNDPLSLKYHDEEWGVPVHDENKLFEFLILEGAQAGLSWQTILRKRENYRKAFDNFNPKIVATYSARKVEDLLKDEGIIRNKLKIGSAVQNAKCFVQIQEEFKSFDRYVWGFVPNSSPKKNHRRSLGELPAKSKESDALSSDLSKRGFKFVGSTICYAFMQATGLVNDHLVTCFRYDQV